MISWKIIRILVLNITVVLLSGCKPADIVLHGDLGGSVNDAATGNPLINANVELYPSDAIITTEFDGVYLFKNLTPGNYEISASKSGYETTSEFVEVFPEKTQEIILNLNRIPEPEFSTTLLDFGLDSTSLSFTISNNGPGNLPYLITASQDWITVHPASGDVTDETDTIHVLINKSSLSNEIYKENVRITSIAGSEIVKDTIEIFLNGAMDIELNYYYKVVWIGSQVWLAENVRTGIFISGDKLQNNNQILETYRYNNIQNNFEVYGGLYQWDEMMQYKPSDNRVIGETQGICPVGWHIPTKQEWITLIDYMGGSALAGIGLKEAGTAHWYAGTGATNSSGFTALPGGFGDPSIPKFDFGLFWGFWWSSTEVEDYSSRAYRVQMSCWSNVVAVESDWGKYWAASVRCVKNQ